MKKLVLLVIFTLSSTFIFSLPNIEITENGKFYGKIENNAFYNETEELVETFTDGKIYKGEKFKGSYQENENILMISYVVAENNSSTPTSEQEQSSPNYITDNHVEIDITTGFVLKNVFYSKGEPNSIFEYNEQNGNLEKETYYESDSIVEQISSREYNPENGIMYKKSFFYTAEKPKQVYEYDKNTGKVLAYTKYNEETGNGTKYTYLTFEDNLFNLEGDTYLRINMCAYEDMAELAEKSKTDYINWNKMYYATITKHEYTRNDAAFKFIKYINESRYLIDSTCVVLYTVNSPVYFCFYVDDGVIDTSSCYLIELTEKPKF